MIMNELIRFLLNILYFHYSNHSLYYNALYYFYHWLDETPSLLNHHVSWIELILLSLNIVEQSSLLLKVYSDYIQNEYKIDLSHMLIIHSQYLSLIIYHLFYSIISIISFTLIRLNISYEYPHSHSITANHPSHSFS